MNKTTHRFHVQMSVENISYLTRFESGNNFTVHKTVALPVMKQDVKYKTNSEYQQPAIMASKMYREF